MSAWPSNFSLGLSSGLHSLAFALNRRSRRPQPQINPIVITRLRLGARPRLRQQLGPRHLPILPVPGIRLLVALQQPEVLAVLLRADVVCAAAGLRPPEQREDNALEDGCPEGGAELRDTEVRPDLAQQPCGR